MIAFLHALLKNGHFSAFLSVFFTMLYHHLELYSVNGNYSEVWVERNCTLPFVVQFRVWLLEEIEENMNNFR
jgi:hypothetical protein